MHAEFQGSSWLGDSLGRLYVRLSLPKAAKSHLYLSETLLPLDIIAAPNEKAPQTPTIPYCHDARRVSGQLLIGELSRKAARQILAAESCQIPSCRLRPQTLLSLFSGLGKRHRSDVALSERLAPLAITGHNSVVPWNHLGYHSTIVLRGPSIAIPLCREEPVSQTADLSFFRSVIAYQAPRTAVLIKLRVKYKHVAWNYCV